MMLWTFGFPQKAGNFLTKSRLDSLEGGFLHEVSKCVRLPAKFMKKQYLSKSVLVRAQNERALFAIYYASECWCVSWPGPGPERWKTFVASRRHRTELDAVILFRNKKWAKTVLKIVPNSPLPTPKYVKALWFHLWFTHVTLSRWLMCWF